MKKKICAFLVLCIAPVLLFGCQKSKRQLCRYVTQIDVYCDHDGLPILRRYTDTEKMEAVLLHLRLLHPGDAPQVDPETVDADLYQICVYLSDGQRHLYNQKDHRYFRCEGSGWQTVTPDRAARLYTVLRHYQSDL